MLWSAKGPWTDCKLGVYPLYELRNESKEQGEQGDETSACSCCLSTAEDCSLALQAQVMANVQQGFGNSPADAYYSIPPVTRYFATACLALTTLVNFKLISPYLIYLSWSHIFKLQVGMQDMQRMQAGDAQWPRRMSAGRLLLFSTKACMH